MGYRLDKLNTEHSTISRTRRLIDFETYQQVFQWVLKVLADYDLIQGKTVGIDATTLEANAAMCSIVRKDTKQNDQEFLTELAKVSGIETPTGGTWRSWIASGRTRRAMTTGRTRATPTRRSPR